MAPSKTRADARSLSRPAALIFNSEQSNWTSCRVITRNLIQAYKNLWGPRNLQPFHFGSDQASTWSIADEIYRARPSKLIFLDHAPHPQELLNAIQIRYESEPLPPLYFHLYGDFTLYPTEWMELSRLLKNKKIAFICASDSQVKLVRRFLALPEGFVFRCPFPVDVQTHRFDASLRQSFRKSRKLTEAERLIVYTGRFSLQKNVTALLRELNRIYEDGQAFRFLCAGNFDDISAPLHGIESRKGAFFQQWQQTLETCSRKFRQKFEFLGVLDSQSLQSLNNAADLFVSLSLHHDEDFGMSPAEALATGCPTVLTGWGGYNNFSSDKWACKLVPVRIAERGLTVEMSEFRRSVSQQLAKPRISDSSRLRYSHAFQTEFSIEAASRILAHIHSCELPLFQGFGWLMERYQESFVKGAPYTETRPGSLYQEVYSHYV